MRWCEPLFCEQFLFTYIYISDVTSSWKHQFQHLLILRKQSLTRKKQKFIRLIQDRQTTKKMVFMSDNWLTLGVLTFSSWNTYDQILFLTLKNNCDNITSTKAFYIQNETGEEIKRRKRTLILVKSKSATRCVFNKGVQKNLGNPLKKAMSEFIFE